MGLSEGEDAGSCRIVPSVRAVSTARVRRSRSTLFSAFGEPSHLSDSPLRRPSSTPHILKREDKTPLLKAFRSRIGPSTGPGLCLARSLRGEERCRRSAPIGDLESWRANRRRGVCPDGEVATANSEVQT